MSRYDILQTFLCIFFLSLGGCSSTDMIESDAPTTADDNLTLAVSVPEAYKFGNSTRADDQHRLRFVAHLYSKGSPNPKQRLEALYVENTTETTLSFKIEEAGDYFVTVFADYITKEGAEKNDRGNYTDKYYDTSTAGKVTAKTGQNDFFNNDNRDCFVGKATFTKGVNSISHNLTLRRPISKVIISAPDDDIEHLIEKLEISACSHLGSYNFALDNTDGVTGNVGNENTTIIPTSENITVKNPAKQLFFFYTFAGDKDDDSRPALGEISFNLTGLTDVALSAESRTISSGLIKPALNHIVTAKGGKDWISAKPGGNDITVEITTSDKWNESEKSVEAE